VNINASDVVDGKPAVVLGLIWTIILYFQVAETSAHARGYCTIILRNVGNELVTGNDI
jgi:hypothetical protein